MLSTMRIDKVLLKHELTVAVDDEDAIADLEATCKEAHDVPRRLKQMVAFRMGLN